MRKMHKTNGNDKSELDDLDDDSESDELQILGSRLARIASGPVSEKLHRAHRDNDTWDEQSSKRKSLRHREKTHRDKQS